jgi:hypothetical protein
MKKEEFIKYLEGMQQAFEIAGIHNMIDLFDQLILEADTIEVTINNYPYYTQPRDYSPYPWITWYNTNISETVTTAANTICETVTGEKLPQWEVKVTGPNEIDWEINRCD